MPEKRAAFDPTNCGGIWNRNPSAEAINDLGNSASECCNLLKRRQVAPKPASALDVVRVCPFRTLAAYGSETFSFLASSGTVTPASRDMINSW
jgi:hypothetical protein